MQNNPKVGNPNNDQENDQDERLFDVAKVFHISVFDKM